MMKFLLVFILLLFTGCSSKQSMLKVYTLDTPEITEISKSPFRNKTIKVSFPQTLKDKISHKMRYSYSINEQGAYLNSQWSNNIGKLLQGNVIQALEQSQLFKGVLPYESTAGEDYRLESTIFDFSHHVREPSSHAVVSIQFALINTYSGQLIKTKRFSYREATSSIDAQGYVKASNIAVDKMNRDLIKWLL